MLVGDQKPQEPPGRTEHDFHTCQLLKMPMCSITHDANIWLALYHNMRRKCDYFIKNYGFSFNHTNYNHWNYITIQPLLYYCITYSINENDNLKYSLGEKAGFWKIFPVTQNNMARKKSYRDRRNNFSSQLVTKNKLCWQPKPASLRGEMPSVKAMLKLWLV